MVRVELWLRSGAKLEFDMPSPENVRDWVSGFVADGFVTGPAVDGRGFIIPSSAVEALCVPDAADYALLTDGAVRAAD